MRGRDAPNPYPHESPGATRPGTERHPLYYSPRARVRAVGQRRAWIPLSTRSGRASRSLEPFGRTAHLVACTASPPDSGNRGRGFKSELRACWGWGEVRWRGWDGPVQPSLWDTRLTTHGPFPWWCGRRFEYAASPQALPPLPPRALRSLLGGERGDAY